VAPIFPALSHPNTPSDCVLKVALCAALILHQVTCGATGADELIQTLWIHNLSYSSVLGGLASVAGAANSKMVPFTGAFGYLFNASQHLNRPDLPTFDTFDSILLGLAVSGPGKSTVTLEERSPRKLLRELLITVGKADWGSKSLRLSRIINRQREFPKMQIVKYFRRSSYF
jgi:hypothetical protein